LASTFRQKPDIFASEHKARLGKREWEGVGKGEGKKEKEGAKGKKRENEEKKKKGKRGRMVLNIELQEDKDDYGFFLLLYLPQSSQETFTLSKH